MKFFGIDFATAPATEGELIEYVTRVTCDDCGLRAVPISNRYLVPEDTVSSLHLETEDSKLPDIFVAAGMLISTAEIAQKLCAEVISGFEIRSVRITNCETGKTVNEYVWLAVTGRCETNPVWHKVLSRCKMCGMEKTEAVSTNTRIATILRPLPTTDVFRSRERSVGIIVSDKVRELLLASAPGQVEFKVIPHE
jgi:hypothetical protein